MITSLNGMQRTAMQRAMAGDFELADAMELLSPRRMRGATRIDGLWREYNLQYGIWIGGRLQAFAYGQAVDADDDDATSLGGLPVRLVLNLNGDVLFHAESDEEAYDIQIEYSDGRSQGWAQTIVDAYREQLANPSQQNLFQEAA